MTDYPLLPAPYIHGYLPGGALSQRPPDDEQIFGLWQPVRIPLGDRVTSIQAVEARNGRWWYAVNLLDGRARKWYAQDELLALRPQPGDLLEYRGQRYICLTSELLIVGDTPGDDPEYLTTWALAVWLDYRIIKRGHLVIDERWQRVIARWERRMAREEYEPTYALDYVEDGADQFGQRTYAIQYRRAG